MTTMVPEDQTPYNELRALRKRLEGIKVTSSNRPGGTAVPVRYVGPDFELASADFPGIYISYAGFERARDREHRGPIRLAYAPPGFTENVQVPADWENKDSTATVNWADDHDPIKSPYTSEEWPIPYNLDFNVTVATRTAEQNFQLVWALQQIDRLPERFGGLEIPQDGTVRTLELLGGPMTSVIRDEAGKRLVQSVYSVRVAAEVLLHEVETVKRVVTVNSSLVLTPVTYDEEYL